MEKRLPNGSRYLSSLYRCLNCHFGFTDVEQFVVKPAADSSRSRMAAS
jgi:hypothetical protein